MHLLRNRLKFNVDRILIQNYLPSIILKYQQLSRIDGNHSLYRIDSRIQGFFLLTNISEIIAQDLPRNYILNIRPQLGSTQNYILK